MAGRDWWPAAGHRSLSPRSSAAGPRGDGRRLCAACRAHEIVSTGIDNNPSAGGGCPNRAAGSGLGPAAGSALRPCNRWLVPRGLSTWCGRCRRDRGSRYLGARARRLLQARRPSPGAARAPASRGRPNSNLCHYQNRAVRQERVSDCQGLPTSQSTRATAHYLWRPVRRRQRQLHRERCRIRHSRRYPRAMRTSPGHAARPNQSSVRSATAAGASSVMKCAASST